MSSKNNGFTANDIERYHSGKMSPEERHALEKAALDDPFLADALEGYAFTSTPSADLAKIQSRLDEKLNQKKTILIFQKYKWLSAAAIVLIIVGAGWFTYTISTEKNKSEVAVQKKKEPTESSNYIMPGQTISIDSNAYASQQVNDQSNKIQPTSEFKKKESNNNVVIIQKSTEGLVGNLSAHKAVGDNEEKPQLDSTRRLLVTENEVASINKLSNNVSPQAASRNNALLPNVQAKNSSNVRREQPDNRNVAANNSSINGRVQGTVSANDTIKNLNIVLQPLSKDSMQSLQEVVIGYGMKKKSDDKYPHVIIDTLEPAEGYVNFDDYVAANLKMPEDLKTKTISGEVQLSFDVDKDGQPTNITVVKSLCKKCDEEAIRLLKEGPKWKKKKNKKGKITIKF